MATNYKNQFSRANSVDLKLRYDQYLITNCYELLMFLRHDYDYFVERIWLHQLYYTWFFWVLKICYTAWIMKCFDCVNNTNSAEFYMCCVCMLHITWTVRKQQLIHGIMCTEGLHKDKTKNIWVSKNCAVD